MMTFANPELLWLLAALPLLFVLGGRKGGTPSVRYSNTAVVREAAGQPKRRWWRLWPLVRTLAAALLIIALARPQLAQANTRVQASGVDVLLGIDVSSSMDALDMELGGQAVDRLTAVKRVVASFIEARPNDRIGIVAFAGAPYLVSPLTLDHGWLLENLERLETGLIEDGTAVGSALLSGTERLSEQDAKSKVMVLLTDGVNNAGEVQPSLAAETAAAMGVKVYTVGVGSVGEARIPVRDESGRVRMVTADVDVDEETLSLIADKTKGRFFRATDTASLASVYQEIDRMEPTERTIDRFESYQERFGLFLFPAIGLVLVELLGRFALFRRIP